MADWTSRDFAQPPTRLLVFWRARPRFGAAPGPGHLLSVANDSSRVVRGDGTQDPWVGVDRTGPLAVTRERDGLIEKGRVRFWMLSRSQSSEIANALVAAKRAERAERSGFFSFNRPLPDWFQGPHLDGLTVFERRERYNDLLKSAMRDPWWVLVSLLVCAAIVLPAFYMTHPPIALLVAGPSVLVILLRQYALRRRFQRESKALAALEHKTQHDCTDPVG